MHIGSWSRGRWIIVVAFLAPFIALVIERNLEFPIIINPDGVNYAILAEEYSEGRLRNAINGYWGPAISWLMAVPIAFGVEALSAFRVINALVLIGVVLAVWWLTRLAEFPSALRFLALWATGLITLPWSLEVMTPDLLMLLVLLVYFGLFLLLGPDLSLQRIVALGTVGGIGFLVKPFGLTLFLATFTLLFVYLAINHRETTSIACVVRRYLIGMGAFLVVVIPWIAALSWKYGRFTVGSSGQLNLTLVAPSGSEWVCRPGRSEGLQAPPFSGGVACLDPSLPPSPTWFPLESPGALEHFIKNLLVNLSNIIDMYALILFVLGGVIVTGLAALLRVRAELPEFPVRVALFAIPYVALYSMVVVNSRYLWPAILLLFLGGFSIVGAWANATRGPTWPYTILAVPLALIMILGPAWRPIHGIGRETLDLVYSGAIGRNRAGTEAREDADLLDRYTDSRIAANTGDSRWLYVAYMLDSGFYGYASDGTPPRTVIQFLTEHEIDVFFLWGEEAGPKPNYLDGYELSDTFHDGTLKVYTRDSGPGSDPAPQPEATPSVSATPTGYPIHARPWAIR